MTYADAVLNSSVNNDISPKIESNIDIFNNYNNIDINSSSSGGIVYL